MGAALRESKKEKKSATKAKRAPATGGKKRWGTKSVSPGNHQTLLEHHIPPKTLQVRGGGKRNKNIPPSPFPTFGRRTKSLLSQSSTAVPRSGLVIRLKRNHQENPRGLQIPPLTLGARCLPPACFCLTEACLPITPCVRPRSVPKILLCTKH